MSHHQDLEQIFRKADQHLKPVPTQKTPDIQRIDPETIQVVVFDIYGTLVVSGSGDISVDEEFSSPDPRLQALLEQYGINIPATLLLSAWKQSILDDHQKKQTSGREFPEVDILEVWQHTFTHLEIPTPANLQDFAATFESIINPTSPMPGLIQTLNFFQSRGVPLGIVSNAQFYTPIMLRTFLDQGLVAAGFHPDLMVFSYQYGFGKPSLELYRILAHRLSSLEFPSHGLRHIGPEHVLYIGNDMLKDCWAASQIGFRTLLFAGDERSLRMRNEDLRCRDFHPDGIITQLEQLIPLFEKKPH